MRIELLKIQAPREFDFAQRVTEIGALPLEKRNRLKGGDNIRLEYHERKGNLWFCDFIRLRMNHGPARAGVGSAAEGFDLDENEGFGEETGLLWDSGTGWCVVQYNHYGVRPPAIAEYLGLWDHANPISVEFQPKLDSSVQAKVRSKKFISKVAIVVAPKLMGNDDFDIGGGLGTATKVLKAESQAERIEITISAKRKGSIDIDGESLRRWARRLANDDGGDAAVTSARITARGVNDQASEVLDLIKATVSHEVGLTLGPDRRYPRADRWGALATAQLQWANLMRG